MIETEAQAPGVPVKQNRKQQRQCEQNCISALVSNSLSKNQGKVGSEDQGFGGYDVQVDRPDEISLLACKAQPAICTLSSHLEKRFVKLAEPASRTLQFQASNQMLPGPLNLHA